MNAESSRSHLIIGVVIESINLANGTVHRGKVRRTMNTINIMPDKKGVMQFTSNDFSTCS